MERFPPTRWSVLDAARTVNEERRLAALEKFLNAYYDALLVYLSRQFELPEDQARDYLHEFVLSRLIRKNLLAQADRTRGRFRNLLLRSLNRFVIDELRKEKAGKRSPAQSLISLTDLEAEELDHLSQSAQAVFDLEFARGVVRQALKRMHTRCEASDRKDLWKVFDERVLGEAFDGKKPLPYDQLIGILGIDTPAEAANLLTSAKRMFARVFKSVVCDYESDETAVEVEIRHLWQALSKE